MSGGHRVTRRRHYSRRLASLRGRGPLGEPLTPDLARHAADSRDWDQRLPEAAVQQPGVSGPDGTRSVWPTHAGAFPRGAGVDPTATDPAPANGG